MARGFVYILTNPDMPGLLLIGQTSGSPQNQARQLSESTGAPSPFVVAYTEELEGYEQAERDIHVRLAPYQDFTHRKFYRMPLDQAIPAVKEIAAEVRKKERSAHHDSGKSPAPTAAVPDAQPVGSAPAPSAPTTRGKRRFYDVWIVEANTVYREVPFDVVADWVQQGRLLEDDMLRPSGTSEWRRLGDVVDFSVYIPKPPAEPELASAVEPMEPVEPGFTWRRRSELEESEVDMIPLIDVSLVLLIFFMLTTRDIGSGGPPIPTAPITNGQVASVTIDSVWVGIDLEGDGAARRPVYSFGVGGGAKEGGDNLSRSQLLDRLRALLAGRKNIDLTVYTNPDLPFGDKYALMADLSRGEFRTEIGAMFDAGSDKKP